MQRTWAKEDTSDFWDHDLLYGTMEQSITKLNEESVLFRDSKCLPNYGRPLFEVHDNGGKLARGFCSGGARHHQCHLPSSTALSGANAVAMQAEVTDFPPVRAGSRLEGQIVQKVQKVQKVHQRFEKNSAIQVFN
jgi:hypothetical protein